MLYQNLIVALPFVAAAPLIHHNLTDLWPHITLPNIIPPGFIVSAVLPVPTWSKDLPKIQRPHQPSVANTILKRWQGQVVTGSAAVHVINNHDGVGAGRDEYVEYKGDGSTGAGWPAMSSWASFEDMFNKNREYMFHSCSQGQTNDSPEEVDAIYNAIQQVAAESRLDHRFILAIMMQESGGCVRVQTTNYGFNNPGLMQDFEGQHSCDANGVQANPCPQSEIVGMIQDGSSGTPTGDGLAGLLNQVQNTYGATGAQAYYYASRRYNSGSVAADGDLSSPNSVATKCYTSDIANRLTGWVHAPRTCTLDGW